MAEVTLQTLSGPERNSVSGLKRQVSPLADRLAVVRESAGELAPKVMKLFNELAAKYEDLGGFVGFARLFDPTMATHAADKDGEKGYRTNKTYVALDYMRRTLRLTNRPRGTQGRRDPATDQLARTLATIMQIVRGTEDRAVIWSGIAGEFGLTDRAIARLKTRVDSAKPLLDLSGVRAVRLQPTNVIHVDREAFNNNANANRAERAPAEQPRRARAARRAA